MTVSGLPNSVAPSRSARVAADPPAASIPAWTELDRARGPDGETLILRRRAGLFEIRCDGWDLISNRAHHSEQLLGQLACDCLPGRSAPHILIGGLGMGYTLRAALDVLPPAARVTVGELVAGVVAWNRGPLADLAGRPLEDPRVQVQQGDVARMLHPGLFDAVVLDIDNGPAASVLARNTPLYACYGLRRLRAALVPGGRLAIWSADRAAAFEARLGACGLDWRCVEVPARGRAGDPLHALYLAQAAGDSA